MPNTNQSGVMGGNKLPRVGDDDILEKRYKPLQGKDGRFISTGGSKKKKKRKPKEKTRLSSEIATNFPNLKPGTVIESYANRNHKYKVSVNEFGDYQFSKRKPLK